MLLLLLLQVAWLPVVALSPVIERRTRAFFTAPPHPREASSPRQRAAAPRERCFLLLDSPLVKCLLAFAADIALAVLMSIPFGRGHTATPALAFIWLLATGWSELLHAFGHSSTSVHSDRARPSYFSAVVGFVDVFAYAFSLGAILVQFARPAAQDGGALQRRLQAFAVLGLWLRTLNTLVLHPAMIACDCM